MEKSEMETTEKSLTEMHFFGGERGEVDDCVW